MNISMFKEWGFVFNDWNINREKMQKSEKKKEKMNRNPDEKWTKIMVASVEKNGKIIKENVCRMVWMNCALTITSSMGAQAPRLSSDASPEALFFTCDLSRPSVLVDGRSLSNELKYKSSTSSSASVHEMSAISPVRSPCDRNGCVWHDAYVSELSTLAKSPLLFKLALIKLLAWPLALSKCPCPLLFGAFVNRSGVSIGNVIVLKSFASRITPDFGVAPVGAGPAGADAAAAAIHRAIASLLGKLYL